METRTYNVYKFKELPEDAQEKAIEKLSDINVDYEWWDSVYDDAKNIGLEITKFDIYHGTIDGKLKMTVTESVRAIYEDHGKKTDTYQTAKKYRKSALRFARLKNPDYDGENELAEEYRRELLKDYLSLLRQEYDYRTSKEVIIETIEANDYDFTEDGKLTKRR